MAHSHEKRCTIALNLNKYMNHFRMFYMTFSTFGVTFTEN